MPSPVIRRLRAISSRELEQLSEVLIDCVKGGASIGFVEPFTLADARSFWVKVGEETASGERILLVAEDGQGICGTVQLNLNLPPNQPHRGDLVKMLVHRRVRRQGIGAALMQAAEAEALNAGRTLLVLDAVTNGDGARLYESLGWAKVGDIPDYALYPDGRFCSTTYFYRKLG